jgi:hypothetical protein
VAGELELILRPNRRRYLLLLLSCAGLVAGALAARKSDPINWVGILLFGSGVIVFGLLLLPGSAYLKLDPAGFTVCSLFRPHSTCWYEVDSFQVARIGGRKLVAFNYSNLHRGQEFARKLSSAIAGYEGALTETYGLSAERLAAMMNDWRQRGLYLPFPTNK